MPSAARSIRANGIDLTFDTFGDRAHPPVLLILGLGVQMIGWDDAFCAELAGRGRWVVRFDNRDVGLSTKFNEAGVPDIGQLLHAALLGQPVTVPYRLTDMAADAIGLLDALAIDAAHVVGVSMGGAIAQTMAIEQPQRLRTLTSIMASSGHPALPPPTPEAMQALLTPTPLDYPGYLARYLKTWNLLRAGTFPLDEARDEERAKAAFDRGLNPPGVARQLAAIIASGSRREALAGVRTPTLVIHGDADPLVTLSGGERTAEVVPGAELLVLEGMGHDLPSVFWPTIIEHITQLAARAAVDA
jgi:pimeloyl-ACP methyl ester carboxylesterase